MIMKAQIINADDEILTLKSNGILFKGFSNVGTTAEIGATVLVEIVLWGDISMEPVPFPQKKLQNLYPGLAYYIWGKLDVKNKVISSVFDFDIDDNTLAGFSYLDQRDIRLSIERFELSILTEIQGSD